MEIKQRKEKIPFLIFFLAVSSFALLFGLFAPDSSFSKDDKRSAPLFVGMFGLVSSTVWYFFGSIDWSTWNTIKDNFKKDSPKSDPDDVNKQP